MSEQDKDCNKGLDERAYNWLHRGEAQRAKCSLRVEAGD
jgi:hypothetical protein